MISVMILAFILIFLIAGIKGSPYLWFFAGAGCWGLGAWWIHNPIVASGDPVNDIMLVLAFFGGLAMMFMIWWRVKNNKGVEESGFNIRLPRIMGGRTEEEEDAERRRRTSTWRDRREAYIERLNNASKGKR